MQNSMSMLPDAWIVGSSASMVIGISPVEDEDAAMERDDLISNVVDTLKISD